MLGCAKKWPAARAESKTISCCKAAGRVANALVNICTTRSIGKDTGRRSVEVKARQLQAVDRTLGEARTLAEAGTLAEVNW